MSNDRMFFIPFITDGELPPGVVVEVYAKIRSDSPPDSIRPTRLVVDARGGQIMVERLGFENEDNMLSGPVPWQAFAPTAIGMDLVFGVDAIVTRERSARLRVRNTGTEPARFAASLFGI